jgi:hypothetical protein
VRTIPLINPAAAQLSLHSNGHVLVDDPDAPLLAEIGLNDRGRIDTLIITCRHPTGRITAATIRRIPIGELHRLAVAMRTAGLQHETWWRADAIVKHGRSWDDDHWRRVLAAAAWAERIGRPGGATQAIADLWGVTRRPTAYRWLVYARSLPGASSPSVSAAPTGLTEVTPAEV